MAKAPPPREAPQTLTDLMRPSEVPPPPNAATVQPSNIGPGKAVGWELASYKIEARTKAAMNSWVRGQQAGGAKITIGGQVNDILIAWLKTQGVEVGP